MSKFFGIGASDPFVDFDVGFDTDPFELGFDSFNPLGDVFRDHSFGRPGYFPTSGYHPFFDTMECDTGRGRDQGNVSNRPMRRYTAPRRRNTGGMPSRRSSSFATKDDRTSSWLPDWDVVNKDDQVLILMEVPGMSKDAIKIDVEDGRLVVSGERPMDEKLEASDSIRIREREVGHFKRRVKLPEGCDIHKISATIDNGILKVKVLKGTSESAVHVNIQ